MEVEWKWGGGRGGVEAEVGCRWRWGIGGGGVEMEVQCR